MFRLIRSVNFGMGGLLCLVMVWMLGSTAWAWAANPTSQATGNSQFFDLSDWAGQWNWAGKDQRPTAPQDLIKITEPKAGQPPAIALKGAKGPAIVTSLKLHLIPGHRYRFGLQAWRQKVEHDHYLLLDIFGRKQRLNQHWTQQGWQTISATATFEAEGNPQIRLINYTNSLFKVRRAYLIDLGPAGGAEDKKTSVVDLRYDGFPLAAYVSPERVEEILGSPLNTVITSVDNQNQVERLTRLARLGVRSIISCPRNPFKIDKFSSLFKDLSPKARPIHFYLSDEPELRSELVGNLKNIRELLITSLPWASTATAIVRPQTAPNYSPAYDAIFMDQYPIPDQPLNWLADSIVQAKNETDGNTKIWAVIQAFGEGPFTKMGWPRLPTIDEFQALTFSALTAGAEGLAFYAWRYMADDPDFIKPALGFLTKLSRLTKWFPLTGGLPAGAKVEFVGRTKTNPSGGPAVRFGHRSSDEGQLLIAVNETPFPVHVELSGLRDAALVSDLWSGGYKRINEGQIFDRLAGYGVRAWLIQSKSPGGAD